MKIPFITEAFSFSLLKITCVSNPNSSITNNTLKIINKTFDANKINGIADKKRRQRG